jgi:hypothetical protein
VSKTVHSPTKGIPQFSQNSPIGIESAYLRARCKFLFDLLVRIKGHTGFKEENEARHICFLNLERRSQRVPAQ